MKKYKNNSSQTIKEENKEVTKVKTEFQKEWENGIPIEEVRTKLLKKVNDLWNKKVALAKK
jgi:asparagine synthetase A